MRKALNSKDIKFIEEQLGRRPRGIIEVSSHCKSGHPLVVKTKPLLVESGRWGVESEIFPTLYYLVCGSVIEQVSKLESESFLSKMQQKVDSDNNFRAALLKAQEEYRKERNALVDVPLNKSQKEALQTGIGGVKKLDRIKCLHCHLAHYLAGRDNPVGEEVYKKIGTTCQ